MFKKLPNSTRKFIRLEKARIRRQFLDYKAQEEAIANMYSKILNQPITKEAEAVEPIKTEKILPQNPSLDKSYGRAKQEKEKPKKTKRVNKKATKIKTAKRKNKI